MAELRCFAPLCVPDTRILILGSLPGQASLAANQYYAHPRNQFWRLMGDIINLPLPEMSYSERVSRLMDAGVGLWDVVASAERKGSLDAALRQVDHNDLLALVEHLPSLRAVAFNGATAARARKQLAGTAAILLPLPSSSPAFTLAYAAKLALWRELDRYL